MAHRFSPNMANMIYRTTGLTPLQISNMPIEDAHAAIEKKIGHKLTVKREPNGLMSQKKWEKILRHIKFA